VDATTWARELLDPVPVHRTLGLEVVAAVAGLAEVAIETRPAISNVVGSLHASGLVTLVDAGGLAAIISVAESRSQLKGLLPLGAQASLEFHKPARGRVTGRCALSSDTFAAVRAVMEGQEERVRIKTTTVLTDADAVTVCTGTFGWSIRRLASPGVGP
jgi:acyl-coenzyme A thioesterase PaaI-like protein